MDCECEYWQVVFNPVVGRALHGPGTRRGWSLELAPSLEYYAAVRVSMYACGRNHRSIRFRLAAIGKVVLLLAPELC